MWDQKCLICAFWGWNLTSAPSNLSNCKISQKTKMLRLGPKMRYLGIFGLEFKTIIAIFEISTFEFA